MKMLDRDRGRQFENARRAIFPPLDGAGMSEDEIGLFNPSFFDLTTAMSDEAFLSQRLASFGFWNRNRRAAR